MVIRPEAIARIEAAIAATEPSSRAELVAMIAQRAGHYRATGLAGAILGALVAGLLLASFGPWMTISQVLLVQLVTFAVIYGLLELTPFGDRLTPATLKINSARRLAQSSFLEHGLAATPERTAILFFVSLAEHHVEIIADSGIHGRVAEGEWRRIVDAFTAKVRAGDVEGGFIAAINDLGALLAQHYPRDAAHADSVPNRLILLP